MPMKQRRYRTRISGPVRDRIDIFHQVLPVSRGEMRGGADPHGATTAVAGRVKAARERQRARYADLPWRTNGEIPGYEFRRLCPLPLEAAVVIEDAVAEGALTQRGADRVARLAWTVADLEGAGAPDVRHAEEALFLRTDRPPEQRRALRPGLAS